MPNTAGLLPRVSHNYQVGWASEMEALFFLFPNDEIAYAKGGMVHVVWILPLGLIAHKSGRGGLGNIEGTRASCGASCGVPCVSLRRPCLLEGIIPGWLS